MSSLYPLLSMCLAGTFLVVTGDRLDRWASWVASLGLALALASSFIPDPVGLPFFNDALSTAFLLLILSVSLLVCVYSHRYVELDRARFFGLLCLFSLGMAGSVVSRNLVLFYVFWEFMLLPSYLLIEHWAECPKGRALAVATKYFIFTHLGGALMVVSIVTFYMSTGTFDLLELASLAVGEVGRGFELACVLMIAGLAFKVAVFPLHVWLPDAHSEAPTPISAMLSGLMVHVGIYVMVRVLGLSHHVAEHLCTPLLIGGALTLIYGSAAALMELDIKRVLAFSSISQLGYMVASMGLASALGLLAAALHAISHGLFKSLLFLTAGTLAHAAGSRDLRVLRGIGGELKVFGALFTIGALSLAAIPPLNGFFTKEFIVEAALEEGYLRLAILMLLGSALTMAYVARLICFVYGSSYRPLKEHPARSMIPPSVALGVACALGLPLGVMLLTPARDLVALGLKEHLELHVNASLLAASMLALLAGLALWFAYWRISYGVYLGRLSSLLSSGLGIDHAYSRLAKIFLRSSRALLETVEGKLRTSFLEGLPDSAMSMAKRVARLHEKLFFSKAKFLPMAARLRSMHPSRAVRWALNAGLALLALCLAWLAASLGSFRLALLVVLALALASIASWRRVKGG